METARQFRANKKYDGQACAWCQQAFSIGVTIALCNKCSTAHHAQCWKQHLGCSATDCANAPLHRLDAAVTAPADATASAQHVPGFANQLPVSAYAQPLQAHPTQNYPGQGYTAQNHPGQGYTAQNYPGQGYTAQNYPGQQQIEAGPLQPIYGSAPAPSVPYGGAAGQAAAPTTMRCPGCHQMTSANAYVCHICRTTLYAHNVLPAAPGATSAMVCGIIAILPFVGLVLGPIAIREATTAKRAIQASPNAYGGAAMATAGFITGTIGLCLSLLWLVVVAVS